LIKQDANTVNKRMARDTRARKNESMKVQRCNQRKSAETHRP